MALMRTFIAVAIPDDVRAKAGQVIRELSLVTDRIRWVEPRQAHITLKFLGDIKESDVHVVCSRMSAVAARFESFIVDCAGVGAFPELARAKTLWLGIDDPQEGFLHLNQAVEHELQPLGFPREQRMYRPHLTLGRVRSSSPRLLADLAARLLEFADFAAGRITVDQLTLFASELTAQGPHYFALGRARFGEG